MGQALVDQVEASVEEAVSSATWTDIQVPARLCLHPSLHELPVVVKNISYLFFILAPTLAVLANFAQLPVDGGRRDVDQPGHEKH